MMIIIISISSASLLSLHFSGDEAAVERIAYEFCEDQAECGVFYFEARYCPHLLASCGFDGIKESKDLSVTPERVVKAVNRGLRRGEIDFHVIARSILCCMRHKPGNTYMYIKWMEEKEGPGGNGGWNIVLIEVLLL